MTDEHHCGEKRKGYFATKPAELRVSRGEDSLKGAGCLSPTGLSCLARLSLS